MRWVYGVPAPNSLYFMTVHGANDGCKSKCWIIQEGVKNCSP